MQQGQLGGFAHILDGDLPTTLPGGPARIVVPSETSLNAFSVHEVVGPCLLAGSVCGRRFELETRGIVEFSGGAGGD